MLRRKQRVVSVSSVLEQAIPARSINIGRSGGMRRRRLALKLQQLRMAEENRDNGIEDIYDGGEEEEDAEEQGESLQSKQGHLYILFKMLQYNGLSTYNYARGEDRDFCFLKFIQMIWIAIAFAQSVIEMKYVWMGAVSASKETEIGLYIELAQKFLLSGIRLSLVWTVVKKSNEVSATIEAATRIQERNEQALENVATTVGLYTIGMLLVSVEFVEAHQSLQYFLSYHSAFLKSTLLAWNFSAQYGIFMEELENGGNTFLGLTYGIVTQLDQIAHLLVFLTILANFLAWRRFSLEQDATAEDFEEPGCLEKYAELKNFTKTSNDAFEMLFRFYFLRSIFKCVILVEHFLNPEQPILNRGLDVITVSMYLMALYMGHSISRKAAKAEEWARKQRRLLGYVHSGSDVLDEISEGPIGIGTGPMYINDSFVLGYFSVFVAYFFGIVETRNLQTNNGGKPVTCNCNSTVP